jgi:hypothetical protein
MDSAGVTRVREAASGHVVVVHLEAINHCVEPRSAYTGAIVPSDGEVLDL